MPAADLPSRAARIGLIAIAVVAGMVLGAFLTGGFSSDNASAGADGVGPDVGDIRVAAGADGPTSKVEGVGVGFSRTEQGAVAAATNLVLTLEQAVNTDRERAVRSYEILAADEAVQSLTSDMGAAWDEIRVGIAENGPVSSSLFLRTIPVGYDLTRFSDERATVEVWTLTIVAVDGMVEPIANFETAEIEVVWQDDDWKVWSADSRGGPVPAWATTSPPVDVDVFLDAVEEQEGYRYVAR
jgi:hypothetical protein